MNNNLPDQYDGFATPEELNLSKEEIEELRNNKKELSEYARQKIRALMNEPFTASTKDDKLRFYAKGKEVLTIGREEIEELRNNKKELSEYGREKIREKILAIGRECMLRYDEALKKLADS